MPEATSGPAIPDVQAWADKYKITGDISSLRSALSAVVDLLRSDEAPMLGEIVFDAVIDNVLECRNPDAEKGALRYLWVRTSDLLREQILLVELRGRRATHKYAVGERLRLYCFLHGYVSSKPGEEPRCRNTLRVRRYERLTAPRGGQA